MTRYQPIHSRVRQARPTKGAISAITTSISVKGCLVTEGRGAMARSSLLEINASNNVMTVTWLHLNGPRYPRWNRTLAPAFPDVTGEAATSPGTV